MSVFYVYKKVTRFPKRIYKALNKHTLRTHEAVVHSKAGLNEEGELEVPASRQTRLIEKSNAVIITDSIVKPGNAGQPETRITFLNLTETPAPLEIFTLRKTSGNHELWLNYSGNAELIGEPQRDDFHLLNFEKEKPVQVIINGLNDTNEEGRYQRIYNEHVYVLEYTGELPVKPVKKLAGVFKREIPFEQAKPINLRRLFY